MEIIFSKKIKAPSTVTTLPVSSTFVKTTYAGLDVYGKIQKGKIVALDFISHKRCKSMDWETFINSYSFHATGTEFQISVWKELLTIGEKETVSYQDIADKIGSTTSTRAVGNAIGANPLCILIPCHRVIHKDGSIGHYRFGAAVKKILLKFEKDL